MYFFVFSAEFDLRQINEDCNIRLNNTINNLGSLYEKDPKVVETLNPQKYVKKLHESRRIPLGAYPTFGNLSGSDS